MLEQEKIRVAIVGTGSIADAHIQGFLRQKEGCQIVALVNRTREKAVAYREKYHLEAGIYANLDEACGKEKIDAVAICLPAEFHCRETLKALAYGCHVLVEKPMANSVGECNQMIRAAEKAGKLLSVAFQNRFHKENQRLYWILHEKDFGPVIAGSVNSLWWRGNNYYLTEWRGKWQTEHGGVFLGHAIHQLDLLLWMMGMPSSVTAQIANTAHPDSRLEDMGTAILHYPQALVTLQASLNHHEQKQELIFQTANGQISAPWSPMAQKQLASGFPVMDEDGCRKLEEAYIFCTAGADRLTGHDGLIQNFLKAITGEESLLVNGEDGRNALEVVMAIYKSASSGQTVALPLSDQDPFCDGEVSAAVMEAFMEKVSVR